MGQLRHKQKKSECPPHGFLDTCACSLIWTYSWQQVCFANDKSQTSNTSCYSATHQLYKSKNVTVDTSQVHLICVTLRRCLHRKYPLHCSCVMPWGQSWRITAIQFDLYPQKGPTRYLWLHSFRINPSLKARKDADLKNNLPGVFWDSIQAR